MFDPVLKNDAFAGSTPMHVAYIVFRISSQCNFLTGNYWKLLIFFNVIYVTIESQP